MVGIHCLAGVDAVVPGQDSWREVEGPGSLDDAFLSGVGLYDRWAVPDGRLVSAADSVLYSGGVDVDYSAGDCDGEEANVKPGLGKWEYGTLSAILASQ